MLKKLRNRKYLKQVKETQIELAIIQGKIDYYEADLKLNWDKSDKALYAGMMLAKYENMKIALLNTLLDVYSKMK